MMMNIVRNAVAAAGAACALALVSTMDANPSLYLFDMLVVNDHRLKQYFHGKTIWITGASSGIGAELARQISRYGVRNLILTGRSEERLQAVADGCFATDGIGGDDAKTRDMTTISILPLDMSASAPEFQKAVDRLQNILGENQLDCVILNAGTGQLQPAFQTSSETTETIFQVNTFAPITICQILIERGILRQDKGRHVVVTSSVGAKIGVPLSASYAGSKWALHGYLHSLQAEMPWLRIDLVCPGPVDTHFHSNRPMDNSTKEKREVSGTDDVITKSSKKQLKMSVERCTRLYLSSLILQSGGEHWIAEQPTLLGLYINQYFPSAFQKVLNKIGPLRVQAWQDGKDLYDPDTWKNMGQEKK